MTKNEKAADVDVLGTSYAVFFQTEDVNPKLRGADGLCEIYSHKIIVDPSGGADELAYENVAEYFRKVLRHEALHAFFAESGLRAYSEDEVLVDFLAMQHSKLRDLMDTVNKIDIPREA